MSIVNHTKITVTPLRGGQSYTLLDTQEGTVGQVVAGIPITERVDNNLYSMALTVKGRDKTLFSEFDIVTFDITDSKGTTSTKWIVGSDNLQQYQPNHLTYTHELTLIEPTKILEKFKIFSLNLTNKEDTLNDQIGKAFNNAEIRVGGQSYNTPLLFVFKREFADFIRSQPSEDFYFSNTDFRTVLDTMLTSINCRSYVEDIRLDANGDIDQITIGYRSLETAQKITPNWTKGAHGDVASEEQKNSCQDYAGKIFTRGYNSFGGNYISIMDIFKSGNANITDESALISFPFPIGENGIKEFVIKNALYPLADPSARMDIDISSCFVPEEQYELLSSDKQKEHIPYKIDSRSIGVGRYSNQWWIITTNRMRDIISGLKPTNTEIANAWQNCTFKCTYHAQIDTASEVTKPNTYDKDHIRMGLLDSQNENNLDITRHGKHQLSLIRRTGNPEWYIDVVATNFSNLLPLMAKIDDGYVIYEKEVAVYDRFVKCRYCLSKDFNAISSKAGVNRTKHLYDIPLESDECPLINKQYLVFSKGVPEYGIDKTYSDNALRNAVLTLVGGTEGVEYTVNDAEKTSGVKIKYLLLKTSRGETSHGVYEDFPQRTENSDGETPYGNAKYVFMRPTLNYGQAKNMYFVSTVLDNYSIDYARDGYRFSFWGDGGHRMTYCRYVSNNAESIGECSSFTLDYAYDSKVLENQIEYTDDEITAYMKMLPVADSTDFIKCTDSPFKITYYKDRTQRPVFFTAIESIPAKDDFDNIVIGTAFARENNLVVGSKSRGLSLYISATETINDTVDNIIIGNYERIGHPSSYFTVAERGGCVVLSPNVSALELTSKSWVIANDAGEVYIGANGSPEPIRACFQRYPAQSYTYPTGYVAVFSDYAGGTQISPGDTGYYSTFTLDIQTGLFTLSNPYDTITAKVDDVFYAGRGEGSDTGNPYTSLMQLRVNKVGNGLDPSDPDYISDISCAYGYITAERS